MEFEGSLASRRTGLRNRPSHEHLENELNKDMLVLRLDGRFEEATETSTEDNAHAQKQDFHYEEEDEELELMSRRRSTIVGTGNAPKTPTEKTFSAIEDEALLPAGPRVESVTPVEGSKERDTSPVQITDTHGDNRTVEMPAGYSLISVLGEGAHGVVWKARHELTDMEVAIKFIPREDVIDESSSEWREVAVLKRLHHPHVVRLYDVIHTKTHVLLVLEYLSGGELFDYLINRQRLSEAESRRFFRQLLSALLYCHHKRVVHRDLKLENLLLASNGTLKVTDFGFSNVFCDETMLSTFVGSPAYAAPEILRNEKYMAPCVDVWSVGVILFTMLTGEMPFRDENAATSWQKVCRAEFNIPEHVSAAARDLILKILVVSPDDRIGLDDIWHHPWVAADDKPPMPSLTASDPEPAVYQRCLEFMRDKLGIDEAQLRVELKQDQLTSNSATYYLLLDKFVEEKQQQDKADECARQAQMLASLMSSGGTGQAKSPFRLLGMQRPSPKMQVTSSSSASSPEACSAASSSRNSRENLLEVKKITTVVTTTEVVSSSGRVRRTSMIGSPTSFNRSHSDQPECSATSSTNAAPSSPTRVRRMSRPEGSPLGRKSQTYITAGSPGARRRTSMLTSRDSMTRLRRGRVSDGSSDGADDVFSPTSPVAPSSAGRHRTSADYSQAAEGRGSDADLARPHTSPSRPRAQSISTTSRPRRISTFLGSGVMTSESDAGYSDAWNTSLLSPTSDGNSEVSAGPAGSPQRNTATYRRRSSSSSSSPRGRRRAYTINASLPPCMETDSGSGEPPSPVSPVSPASACPAGAGGVSLQPYTRRNSGERRRRSSYKVTVLGNTVTTCLTHDPSLAGQLAVMSDSSPCASASGSLSNIFEERTSSPSPSVGTDRLTVAALATPSRRRRLSRLRGPRTFTPNLMCGEETHQRGRKGSSSEPTEMAALDLAEMKMSRFGAATTSTKPLKDILAQVRSALCKEGVDFEVVDGCKFQCRCMALSGSFQRRSRRRRSSLTGADETITWDMQIVRIRDLGLHGIHLARRGGDHWQYKNILTKVMSHMKL